jgi:formylglycine-generating enzyme required for sulfatase activity
MDGTHKPRIFLCHAEEDKPQVKELYRQLKEAGYHPWLDEYDLLPGQDWWQEIERIITDPYNLIVVCLSCQSITKRGVVQQEIARALDILGRMPEDTIYLIPARLEPCQPPRRLSKLQWVDLFEPGGFETLTKALDFEIGKRRPPRLPFEPELAFIPAGEFLIGSEPKKDEDMYESEQPQHTLYLPDYSIAKTLVTNAQYMFFVEATGHDVPRHWKGNKPLAGKEDYPVVYVTWHDTVAYCNWLSAETGKAYRLPSEAEWEKAARGKDGRLYPWGNEWDPQRCNTRESGPRATTPAGQYSPWGDSPYGCADMAGNVWEWTRSLWGRAWNKPDFEYPYDPTDGRENLEAGHDVLRVLRGGSFGSSEGDVRCAYRGESSPSDWFRNGGFRVVVAPGYASGL